ncbi:unnamed protein product [Notodromas monacha]|uniref:Uncharacterized protein n=1 Tax=Notodromas monacha TaxID=399045 RepID=A0A7R9BPB5_9CRUS|nr:unnamed protein product [Notodromas monacha]CAG0918107.1 unnamed protein product [Notodromas monacha]
MAATDLHLVQNYSLSQSDGGNRRSDVELDGAIDARAHMPLALLQHCPSNVHEDQMRMDVVDYSSNAQQVDDDCGGGGGGGDEDSPAQLCHDPPSIASSSSSGHMHMPMSIKVERDGSPNPEVR